MKRIPYPRRSILPPLHEWSPPPQPHQPSRALIAGASVCLATGIAMLVQSEPGSPHFFTRWGFGLAFTLAGMVQAGAALVMEVRK